MDSTPLIIGTYPLPSLLVVFPLSAKPGGSIQRKLSQVRFASRRPRRLLFLEQQVILHNQDVHICMEKTPVRIGRRTHDRLAADVKTGVDEHRTAGPLVK